MSVGVVIALIVGALGGYVLRYGTEPTKAVTTTVTETVAPPGYTAAGQYGAAVVLRRMPKPTLWLWQCSHTGPAEIRVGSPLTFSYSSERRGSRLVVYKLAPGATWEHSGYPDEGSRVPVPLGEPVRLGGGLYAVGCDVGESTVLWATVVRVVPS